MVQVMKDFYKNLQTEGLEDNVDVDESIRDDALKDIQTQADNIDRHLINIYTK